MNQTEQRSDRQQAADYLRQVLPPGSTVYTILRRVSRSGMSRVIDLRAIVDGETIWLSGYAARLLQMRLDKSDQGIKIGGCGMDMGFALVYELSQALHGRGYACLGQGKCPSNYHNNHRDRIRCEGLGGSRFCWRPSAWSRDQVPEGWPEIRYDLGDGRSIGTPAACITRNEDDNEIEPIICPTCQGQGDLSNPEGPERFDLTHTDGYALKHRWL